MTLPEVVSTSALLGTELDTHALAGGAIEDLIVHHLSVVRGGRSFLYLPAARSSAQACWQLLLRLQHGSVVLPGVPGPGERPLSVAARLLEALHSLNWDGGLLELWRARLERGNRGQAAGELAFRKGLARVIKAAGAVCLRGEWVMGLAECLLDRGALREARSLIKEELVPRTRAGQVRLRRLRGWVELLIEGLPRQESACAPEDWSLELPASLVQMRRDWPLALGYLAGREVKSRERGTAEDFSYLPNPEGQAGARRAWGASAYCVFAVQLGGGIVTLHQEVAPGLRRKLVPWLDGRESACTHSGKAEHDLLLNARSVRLHGPGLLSALSDRALALCLLPILDAEGEVAGWVHLEWEHHLIPADACLGPVAQSWQTEVWRQGVLPAHGGSGQVSEGALDSWVIPCNPARLGARLGEQSRSMCAALFHECIEVLGLKLAQRRWWGFVRRGAETCFVESGGGGLAEVAAAVGDGRGLDRCLSSSGVVAFSAPDPRLSIHGDSASGLVLPLLHEGELVALLAIESSRRKDFKPAEVERLLSLVQAFSLLLFLARFRAWHEERFGSDLYFNRESAELPGLSGQMMAASHSRSPVVFCGPSGVGKRMLARWLHWSRGGGGEPLHLIHCELEFPRGTTREEFVERLRHPHGSIVLDDLLGLGHELQSELMACLEAEEGSRSICPADRPQLRGRLILLVSKPLGECAEQGLLQADLAARLERLQIFATSLQDRREDLPGLVPFLCQKLATEERSRAPVISEDAMALLWRQKWRGNLRELEALLFKLVLLFPGQQVGVDEVQAIACRFRFSLLSRLPSKRPRRRDVVQALRTTMKKTGRFNKRRAALYLGWDPDTLVLRLQEMNLDEQSLYLEA
jgi:DNA-binding NtrC family response regulator